MSLHTPKKKIFIISISLKSDLKFRDGKPGLLCIIVLYTLYRFQRTAQQTDDGEYKASTVYRVREGTYREILNFIGSAIVKRGKARRTRDKSDVTVVSSFPEKSLAVQCRCIELTFLPGRYIFQFPNDVAPGGKISARPDNRKRVSISASR